MAQGQGRLRPGEAGQRSGGQGGHKAWGRPGRGLSACVSHWQIRFSDLGLPSPHLTSLPSLCMQAVVNPSDEAYFNLVSSCCNTDDLRVGIGYGQGDALCAPPLPSPFLPLLTTFSPRTLPDTHCLPLRLLPPPPVWCRSWMCAPPVMTCCHCSQRPCGPQRQQLGEVWG